MSHDTAAADAVLSATGVSDGGGPGTARTDAVPAEMEKKALEFLLKGLQEGVATLPRGVLLIKPFCIRYGS